MNKKYLELLKDPRWKEFRQKVWEKDNYTCQICHREDRTLVAHHLYYNRGEDGNLVNPWEYHITELQTLCFVCHTLLHHFSSLFQSEDRNRKEV